MKAPAWNLRPLSIISPIFYLHFNIVVGNIALFISTFRHLLLAGAAVQLENLHDFVPHNGLLDDDRLETVVFVTFLTISAFQEEQ